MYLCDLKVGDISYIKSIDLLNNSKMRLYDLGLIEGTKIRLMLVNNGIKAYSFRNSLIAIRDCDAKKIIIGDTND